jgi:predicted dehydrogenase
MTPPAPSTTTDRRRFLQQGTLAITGAAVLGSRLPAVHVADDATIRLALIGCGNRGAGAVADALQTRDQGPIELYAMADLDSSPLEEKLTVLQEQYADQINVSDERKFIGFEAYKQAIDELRPGDVAMCTTRAYIRPIHVEYAVQKGIHVFMEKPFACDPRGLERMLRAAKAAQQTGSKIAAGLQCRHSPARAALIDKIHSGELGELSYIRANRLAGRNWLSDMGDRSNDLLEQLRFGKIHLLWVGSGHMVDNLIHQIDECCWLMDAWPVSCQAMGGREVGSKDHGQNMDIYSMEYTFADGRKAFCGFRRAHHGHQEFATFVHGSKRAGQFSGNVHQATVHMFKDQRIARDNIAWSPTPDARSPWQYEWMHFVESIRQDKSHNEGERAVYADYAALMARAAAHSNGVVTWDEITGSKFQFCDYLDKLAYGSPPPAQADDKGYFPAPGADGWVEL